MATVAELMEFLKDFPPDTLVEVKDFENCFGPVDLSLTEVKDFAHVNKENIRYGKRVAFRAAY